MELRRPGVSLDPSRAVWSGVGSLQKVAKVKDVSDYYVTQGRSVLGRQSQGEAKTGSAPVEENEGCTHVRREIFYGEPEVEWEVFIFEHQFGNAEV